MPQLHGGKNQQSHHHQQKEHQQEQAQNLLNFLSMYIKLTVMQILLQHLVHIQRHIIFFVLIFQMLDSKMNDIVSLQLFITGRTGAYMIDKLLQLI